jgi:hypothetical protein
VPSIRIVFVTFAAAASLACADALIAPSPDGLTGRWTRGPETLSPSGQYVRTIDFGADGRYLRSSVFRGIYPQQPADAIAALTREYGTYALSSDTLRFLQDSVRTWDYLGGEFLYVGRPGGYIEGPPTDPIIELTATRLTLRYQVNPGAGYVPVVEEYARER